MRFVIGSFCGENGLLRANCFSFDADVNGIVCIMGFVSDDTDRQ